jgi:monoamine oxidase
MLICGASPARRGAVGVRVVVIGGGLGGLAVALRLQASGCDVTVLEQRDVPGGRVGRHRDGALLVGRDYRGFIETVTRGRRLPRTFYVHQRSRSHRPCRSSIRSSPMCESGVKARGWRVR